MEAGPGQEHVKNELPPILASIVERLTPHIYREDALGDALEEYGRFAFPLFLYDVLRWIVVSTVRLIPCSFQRGLVVGEAVALGIAFLEARISAPLFVAVVIGTLALIVRDAHTFGSSEALVAEPGVASAFAVSIVIGAQTVFAVVDPLAALPPMIMLRGAALSLLMVSAWRILLRRKTPVAPPPGRLPEEVRRIQLTKTYKNIWRLNFLWMSACIVISMTNPDTNHDFLMGVLPTVFLMISFVNRSERRELGKGHSRPHSMSDLADEKAEMRRQSKDLFAGTSRAADAAELGLYLVLSYPVLVRLANWFSGDPSAVDWLRIATNFAAILVLPVLWIFIRKSNRKTARLLQEQ